LARLILKGGYAFQLAQVHVHVEEQVQFERFFHVALHIYLGLLRVDAAGKVLGKDYACAALYVFGLRTGGKRVPIGDEEEAFVLVLHLHETLYRSEIVAQVKISCGPDSAYYFFHIDVCLFV